MSRNVEKDDRASQYDTNDLFRVSPLATDQDTLRSELGMVARIDIHSNNRSLRDFFNCNCIRFETVPFLLSLFSDFYSSKTKNQSSIRGPLLRKPRC